MTILNNGCCGGKLLGAGNGGFIFMIIDNKNKKILNKFKSYKIFQPKIDYHGSVILKNKTTIVVVTFLSDSIIDKCIENLEVNTKLLFENSNRRSFK